MRSNINFCVIPECYLDTNLVETLVPPERIGNTQGYNHQRGCNKVVSVMKGKLQDSFAVGILDKDKRPLAYASEFELIADRYEEFGVMLYAHPKKCHYLIFHKPMEQWLLEQARQVGILLDDVRYGLPATLVGLKEVAKHELSKHDARFKGLFHDLQQEGAAGIDLLAKWIAYLKSKPYNADKNVLQQL